MDRTERGTFFSGAGLVWKWQRLLWWIFAVNLIFALFAVHGVVDHLGEKLDHSSASQAFAEAMRWLTGQMPQMRAIRFGIS